MVIYQGHFKCCWSSVRIIRLKPAPTTPCFGASKTRTQNLTADMLARIPISLPQKYTLVFQTCSTCAHSTLLSKQLAQISDLEGVSASCVRMHRKPCSRPSLCAF